MLDASFVGFEVYHRFVFAVTLDLPFCVVHHRPVFRGGNRDPSSREVVVREPNDSYFIEVPNSEGDRVARSLHFCDLLPTTVLKVGPG